jgi:hypothetical protein
VVWAVASAWLCACRALFVSEYDPTTDRGVTALHQEIDAHLAWLEQLAAEPPELESLEQDCDPAVFAESQRDLNTRVRSLILRNEARARNERTVAQLRALQASLATLRQQQQERYAPTDPGRTIAQPGDRCLGTGQIEANRQILEQHVRAILKLELAKRDFRQEE